MSKWKDRNGWITTEQLRLSHSLNPHKGLKTQLVTPRPSPHSHSPSSPQTRLPGRQTPSWPDAQRHNFLPGTSPDVVSPQGLLT